MREYHIDMQEKGYSLQKKSGVRIESIYFLIAFTILLFMPWHSLLIHHILAKKISMIAYWKDFATLALGLIALLAIIFRKQPRPVVYTFLLSAFLALYLIIICLVQRDIEGIYGMRYNLMFFVLLTASLSIPLQSEQISKILTTTTLLGTLCVFYGMAQVAILGPEFLVEIGYPTSHLNPSNLKESFYTSYGFVQRACGPFSGPLAFSIYCSTQILICHHLRDVLHKKIAIVEGIYWAGLILTVTRSTIVASILAIFLTDGGKSFFQRYWRSVLSVLSIISFSAAFIILFPENAISKTAAGLYDATSSGEEASVREHSDSLEKYTSLLDEYFITGYGLGHVGPQAASYSSDYIVPESSYLSALMDMGFIGLIVTALIVAVLIKNSKSILIKRILFVLAAVGVLLPLQYYTEVISIIAIVLGILVRQDIAKIRLGTSK